MKNNEHTPMPWKIAEEVNGIRWDRAYLIRPVDDHNYDYGATSAIPIASPSCVSDGLFIVKACNCFYELVEALRSYVAADSERQCEHNSRLQRAKEILEKAEMP